MSDEGEKFLSRWSRRKRDTQTAELNSASQTASPQDTAAPLQRQEKDASKESVPPQLPPLDELTLDSDFRGFLHPKVDEGVKRAALKKLFSNPHFNVMDGLDTYIDDYSKPDPLPEGMLAQMRSAQKIFKWARNELEEGETAPATLASVSVPEVDVGAPGEEALPPPEPTTHAPATERASESLDVPVANSADSR